MSSRRTLLLASLLALSPVAGQRSASAQSAPPTGFLNGLVRKGNQSMPYVVYVPRDYTAGKKWPVILFLHGAGERGDSGLPQSQVGIGGAIRMRPDRFPCLVVMPQCPTGKGWGHAIQGFIPDSTDTADLALAALDEVMARYSTDPDRVYLTGLSMGGFGTWSIGSRLPERFAALMPICGGGNPAEWAPKLKNLPIWVWHGDQDRAVPVERSRSMVEALKAAGATRVRYTELPGVGHNSWDAAYGNEEAISWLLGQVRGK